MKKCTWIQKYALAKMHKAVKLYIAVFLVLGIAAAPWNRMEAHAVEILATVNGTVLSGTNTGLLKLSTREGYMRSSWTAERTSLLVKYCCRTSG